MHRLSALLETASQERGAHTLIRPERGGSLSCNSSFEREDRNTHQRCLMSDTTRAFSCIAGDRTSQRIAPRRRPRERDWQLRVSLPAQWNTDWKNEISLRLELIALSRHSLDANSVQTGGLPALPRVMALLSLGALREKRGTSSPLHSTENRPPTSSRVFAAQKVSWFPIAP